jgi:hypothetical protein
VLFRYSGFMSFDGKAKRATDLNLLPADVLATYMDAHK